MIRINGLYKDFGDNHVLKGITNHIQKGEVVVVIGPSGSGKSTFLRCLNLLETPTAGEIILEGQTITDPKVDINKVRTKLGMVFQQFNLFPHKTVAENIMISPMLVKKVSREAAHEKAVSLLNRVGLAEKENAYPSSLSGGQQQRAAIARALAMEPDVMLFDEPTSALDPELVGEVLAVIRDLASGGMTMVMATHQMDFARALATEIVFMEHGKLIEQGSPADLLAEGSNTRTRDFCQRLLEMGA